MNDFEEVYKFIKKLANKDGADAEKLTLKAMEELGELSTALLQESGYKSTKKSKKLVKLNQLEEACDVIICMMGIIEKKGWSHEQIINMLGMKSKKWEKTLEKRNDKS